MSGRNANRKKFLAKDMHSCLKKHPDATPCEKDSLLQWVEAGESPWNNPYFLYDETGYPMDYIEGCRIGKEMDRDFERIPSRLLGQLSMAEDVPDFVEPEFDPWGDLPF